MCTLRASELFNEAGLRLVAVESVDIQNSKTGICFRLSGNIKPVAVIVCGTEACYALDMDANPVDIDQLRQDIPGLDAIIYR
jgi:hypothetical protein